MHRKSFVLSLSLALLTALAACDESVTAPTVGGLQVKSIILRTSGGNVIYSHDDHWHGAPLVPVGGTESLELFFSSMEMNADDHEAPPFETWFTLAAHPTLALNGIIEHPSIATWSGGTTVGTLSGHVVGASRISFIVKRGTTTLLEAAPLNFLVQ